MQSRPLTGAVAKVVLSLARAKQYAPVTVGLLNNNSQSQETGRISDLSIGAVTVVVGANAPTDQCALEETPGGVGNTTPGGA